MRNYLVLLLLLLSLTRLKAQNAPSIEWQKSFGGSSNENATSIQQTSDGGYIISGATASNDGDVSGNHGGNDCWIVKLDAPGNMQWQKTLGGTSEDGATSVQETGDGGFIVGAGTDSNDGDVSGNHGDADYWITKLNSSGIIQWQKCFGGSGVDLERCMHVTGDGGCIVAGDSWSNDDGVTGNHGLNDYWIVKLDSTGNIDWQKSLGGSQNDVPYFISQTIDGGYILAGHSNSMNGDLTNNNGMDDYWIAKLDLSGNIQWQISLGGSLLDRPYAIQQTTDEGFIVTGWTASTDGDVSGNHGPNDFWVIKMDSSGNVQWKKCLGGSASDQGSSIQQTTDGGFILAGWTASSDGDVSSNHGGDDDCWIVKLDASGNIQWDKSLGGSDGDFGTAIQQTNDGGFIVAATSKSNDGDVSGNHGSTDYWIVKLSSETTGISSLGVKTFSFYPNPAQSKLNITLAINTAETTIRVFDLYGRMISLPVSFDVDHAELSIESLAQGVYTLQITDKRSGKVEAAKFVKSAE